MALANALVGNPDDAAGLELTGLGPTLFFEQSSCIAWTGGMMPASLVHPNGGQCPVPSHRAVLLPAGSALRFGACETGFRCWLAVSGGIEADRLLESRSQHLAAEFGPARLGPNSALMVGPQAESIRQRMEATLLRDPQVFEIHPGVLSTRWALPSSVPSSWPLLELSCLPGRHLSFLAKVQQQALLQTHWRVSARSSRQGLGLEGEAIETGGMPQLKSEPVREGTVQLPPAGRPVVLLAEHQTTGGYPRVLEVIQAMQPALAQAGPSAQIVFTLTEMEQADALRQRLQRSQAALMMAVQERRRQ